MSNKRRDKKFPKFKSNQDVEQFVESADLSEYDFSNFKPESFEYAAKDKSVTLRIPASLLEAVKDNAKRHGMPYQRYIRKILEHAIH